MLTDFNDFWHTGYLTLVDCKFAHLTWENVTQYLVKNKVVHKFQSTIVFLEKSGWLWKEPVVLYGKINGSNATESVQSNHRVHGHTLPVVSAIGQWPHPRRSAAVQPTSQQAATEKGLFIFPRYSSNSMWVRWANLQPSDVKFLQDSVCQKWLKSVHFRQSYSKNKKCERFFGTQCRSLSAVLIALTAQIAFQTVIRYIQELSIMVFKCHYAVGRLSTYVAVIPRLFHVKFTSNHRDKLLPLRSKCIF